MANLPASCSHCVHLYTVRQTTVASSAKGLPPGYSQHSVLCSLLQNGGEVANLSPDKGHSETNVFGSEMGKGTPLPEPAFQ